MNGMDGSEEHPASRSHNEVRANAKAITQYGMIYGGMVHATANYFTGDAPAHSPMPIPRQLPADVHGFVNRSEALRLLAQESQESAHRVVVCVIMGTPGVGKTSLALRWAHRMVDEFPDGQLYLDLRGYHEGPSISAEEALKRFLHDLAIPGNRIPVDLDTRSALFRSLLAGRRFLIVLDNAATTTQIRPLLPGTAGSLVLVTSRSRLHDLVLREGARPINLELLRLDEAVSLLRDLLADYRPHDDSKSLAALARLCARLPLALRIAAQRVVSRPGTPLPDLVQELLEESNLWNTLTADDTSDAVRTVFRWSYRAIPADARRLFRLLGLHPSNDFDLRSVAALLDSPVALTRRLLEGLVDAHLVERTGADRYTFHDLLRLYARNQAEEEESWEAMAEAFDRLSLWHFHAVSRVVDLIAPERAAGPRVEQAPGLITPEFTDRAEALTWYERERHNLPPLVRAAGERGLHSTARLLADELREIYSRYNHFDDWLVTGEVALTSARRLGDRAGEANALESLGKAHMQRGDRTKGVELQSTALVIRQDLGDVAGEIASTNAIGLIYLRTHHPSSALQHFQRARELAGALDSDYWTAIATNNTANALIDLDRPAEAVPLLLEALTGYRRLSVPGSEGDALRGLSHAHRILGQYDHAREFVERALAIAREQRNRAWEAFWSLEASRVFAVLGPPAAALSHADRSAVLQRELGDPVREAEAVDAIGELHLRIDGGGGASGFHRYSVEVFREFDERWRLALALRNLGGALAAEEGRASAAPHWTEAVELLSEFDDPTAHRHRTELEALLAGSGNDLPEPP
ncbi:Tetratricopeptide repeat-containing protein [Actinosynnema pretiosum]|nr:Tetratricopeptide repeat-containing protein [Actinosynnema pretiosum]